MTRPDVLVLVTGTGTAVGKTWWSAAVARAVRAAGTTVAARKPVQSGEPGAPSDAERLAAATGEDPDAVCPAHRSYPLAWAPPMAAAALGLPRFTTAELAGELAWPAGVQVGLVESVGGPRSPISADGDTVTLAGILHPELVVLVADAGLGVINAVRLAAAALPPASPLVVALNRYADDDPLVRANRSHLESVDGFDVVVSPDELADRLRSGASPTVVA